jgi:formylglycine-generating enzyme required for sulfatase activity
LGKLAIQRGWKRQMPHQSSNPRLCAAALQGLTHTARVMRGGSWNNNPRNARCAYRNRNNPNNFNNNIGFRVVLSIAK